MNNPTGRILWPARLALGNATGITIEPQCPDGYHQQQECAGVLSISAFGAPVDRRTHLTDRQRVELIIALGGDIR